MKNRRMLRILALACALIMLLSVLVGCADVDDPNETENQSQNGGTVSTDPNQMSEEQRNNLPAKQDMGGFEFNMAVQYSSEDHLQYYISSEGLTGDAVSVALYNRNLFLQDYFNITITGENIGEGKDMGQVAKEIQDANLAGDDSWDVCMMVASITMTTLATNGDLVNLLDDSITGFNLGASYWDQRIQQNYAINGMLFCLEGDFTVLDELRTHGVLYNADLYNELQLNTKYGSLYDMVRKGEWTFDRMLEIFKNTTVSSGGSLGKNDRWGMISETMAPYVMLLGSGSLGVRNNDNGTTSLIFDDATQTQIVTSALDDIITKMKGNDEILFADASKGILSASSALCFREASSMFMNDQTLFKSSTLLDATWLGDMDSTFGILPVPMYTEGQDGYYCWTSSAAHTPLSIPWSVYSKGNLDKVVDIVEAMAYFSRYSQSGVSLYDAFYEKMTVAKLCRTVDDYEMLETIYESKTFDLDSAMNITKMLNLSVSAIGEKVSGGVSYGGAGSAVAAVKEQASKNYQRVIDALNEKVVKLGQTA